MELANDFECEFPGRLAYEVHNGSMGMNKFGQFEVEMEQSRFDLTSFPRN
jgi:hypothetical protein